MITQVEIDIVTKLVLSAFLGGIVGFQRELHGNPAGTRTQALVCMGAALFTMLGPIFYIDDPLKMAAGVVTGIGFLAGATIFKSESTVHGLTTAAEIWVMSAIGAVVGAGLYYAAVVATIIILAILGPLKIVESRKTRKK